MDREDIQSRRAANQVWNGAENYDVRPEFQAYDADGEAQLYMNTIIGLVYRCYSSLCSTRFSISKRVSCTAICSGWDWRAWPTKKR